MHVPIDDGPVADLRRLQRQRAIGEIDADTFWQRYAALDTATASAICDTPQCGRPAYIVIDGAKLCSTCAIRRRARI